MAISQHEEEEEQSPSSLLDALYCQEEQLEEDEDEHHQLVRERNNHKNPSSLLPLMLLQQDLFWEDEELLTLFSKEKQATFDLSLSSDRKEAVEWMLEVNTHYGFSTLTSILGVNYLDRFLSSFHFQNDNKPWMFQLAAVTCLSLAAKVEETHVPLLLDLQLEGAKYYFEAKTIQKMELLVLSTLEWKMNPVTPMSFLDHIIRRLGLKNHMHWEFLRRCENLIFSLLSDWRFVSYLPSVLATATMMHVIDQIEPCNSLDYQNQLLSVLSFTKEKVKECYRWIAEKSGSSKGSGKRKYEEMMNDNDDSNNNKIKANDDEEDDDGVVSPIPSSPNGVVDYNYYDYLSESSRDSWEAIRRNKKGRRSMHDEHEQQPTPLLVPSLCRVFVDIVGSPR